MIENESYDPALHVERLRLNDCEVDIVLCEHTRENSTRITTELRGGEVILLESPGIPREKRDKRDKAVTRLVSTSIDPALAMEFAEEMAGTDGGEILSGLIGSDAQVKFIDVCAEDEEYILVKQSEIARMTLVEKSLEGGSMEEVKGCLLYATRIFAESNSARNPVLTEDIKRATEENPGKKIKVMLGTLHYDVIHQLDESKKVNIDLLRSNSEPFEKMVMDFSEDKQPDEELTDRALLNNFLLCYQVKDRTGVIKRANHEAIQRVLGEIDMYLKLEPHSDSRHATITRYLESFVDVMEFN